MSDAMLETPAFVAGFDDVAVMREAIEQRGGHLRVAENAWPFSEGEIGRDNDRCALVEPADEMKQQMPAGLGEREIAEFVEDDEVHAREIIGDPALAPGAGFRLQSVDEIDRIEEAAAHSNQTRHSLPASLSSRMIVPVVHARRLWTIVAGGRS